MKPYYQDDSITIYHGDCREILPTLEPVDLVLTDPPYGGLKGGVVHLNGGVGPHYPSHTTIGIPWQTDLEWIPVAWERIRMGMLVFCSFQNIVETRTAFPAEAKVVALLTWHKRNSPVAVGNVPRFTTEHIWAMQKATGLKWRNLKGTLFDIPKLSTGIMGSPERFVDDRGQALHPTQKPNQLMKTLLAIGGESILDPFAGTGTTLRAAKDLGRKALGIELEEKYCEMAANRMSQSVMELSTL